MRGSEKQAHLMERSDCLQNLFAFEYLCGFLQINPIIPGEVLNSSKNSKNR